MWILIEDNYLNYLHSDVDKRIPYQNYGKGSLKLFFRLFKKGNLTYVAQINQAKSNDYRLGENLGFYKLRDGKKIIGIVNLKYMFPVLEKHTKDVNKQEIRNIVSHNKNQNQTEQYMELLEKEKKELKRKEIDKKAIDLYKKSTLGKLDPNDKKRCLDYSELETKTLQYEVDKVFDKQAALVTAAQEFYFMEIGENKYSLTMNDVEHLSELKKVHEHGYDKSKHIEIDDSYGKDL